MAVAVVTSGSLWHQAARVAGLRIHGFLETPARFYAAAPKGGAGGGKGVPGGKVKKKFETEKDPNKLISYLCGSNYRIDEGCGEDVKLKPDSEYPEWLFTMDVKRPKPMSYEMEAGTIEYWEQVKKEAMAKQRVLMKKKVFKLSDRK